MTIVRFFIVLTCIGLLLSCASGPVKKEEPPVTAEEAAKIGETIKTLFNADRFAEIAALYAPELNQALSPAKTAEILGALKKQVGAAETMEKPRNKGNGTFDIPLNAANIRLILRITLNSSRKLTGYWLLPWQPDVTYPQITEKTTVADIVTPYTNAEGNKSVMVGIVHNGAMQFFQFSHPSVPETERPNEHTFFEIGSISKVFTATLLALMAEKGEVSLDDPAEKYLPAGITLGKDGVKVTLRQLANHTSGLPRLPDNLLATATNPLNPYAHYTEEMLFSFLSSYTLTRKPGEAAEYSNLGAGLLGLLLSRAANKEYPALLTETILSPLGMQETYITVPGEQMSRFIAGHDETGTTVPYWDIPVLSGAGALKATAADMLRFLTAITAGSSDKVFNNAVAATQNITFSSKDMGNIGLGWLQTVLPGDTAVYWHNGGTGGFRSFAGFLNNKKSAVVVLSNSANSVDTIGFLVLTQLAKQEKQD